MHCLVFPYLTAKEHYRLFEFLNDTLVHIKTLKVLNIGTFEMFKTEVLKPLIQYFKIFAISIGYFKSSV